MACRDTETILKELRQIKGTLTLLAAKMGAIDTGITDGDSMKAWAAEQDRIMKNVPVARNVDPYDA